MTAIYAMWRRSGKRISRSWGRFEDSAKPVAPLGLANGEALLMTGQRQGGATRIG